MHDRLHEPYRWRLIKGGDQVKSAALEAGAWGCAISGAGPSILALCTEENGQAVSRAMVKAWEAAGVASRARSESPNLRQPLATRGRWVVLPKTADQPC